ncbi:hypothetical protein C5748_17005 [Phyllobacterium phragmitis]|uniref:Uncharacterized protein n=2 Tax=Phyllobacterium phragmitis TaxID=2670329 RepID=A0A2S9IP58_9HYPH|nr:hypothetical protein C5748_17005 [Phyllobacterium phragmitis]
MIRLGSTVSDIITGLSGVVTGRATYITGCDQYLVAPKEGKESRWFDEQRLTLQDAPIIVLDNSNGNGADLAAPVK